MNSKKKYMICKDLTDNCREIIKNDMCKKDDKIANSLCRKSCNTCKPNNIKYLINKISTQVNEYKKQELGETYLLINDEVIERDTKFNSFLNINDGKEKYSIQERIRRELEYAEDKRLDKLKNNNTKYNYNFNSSLDNYEYSEESIDEEIFDESNDKTYKMEQKRKWEQFEECGDIDVWPFCSKDELEEVIRNPKLLAKKQAEPIN